MTTHTAHRVTADAMSLIRALTAPGEFTLMTWATTVKGAAAHKDRVLVKTTVAAVECGTTYADLANVKAAQVAGKRGPVGELPWGEWVEGCFPYLIGHTPKGGEYREYLRVNFAPAGIVNVTYTVDGVACDRDEFSAYLTPSQRKSEHTDTATIPVANIRSIGAVVLSA